MLIERAEKEIIKKMKKLETNNNKTVKAVEKMKKARVKILRNNKWQIEDKLMLNKWKVYVLKDESLRLEII